MDRMLKTSVMAVVVERRNVCGEAHTYNEKDKWMWVTVVMKMVIMRVAGR